MKVCRRFRFDAAHFLPNYKGKCHNLHGHSFSVDISLEGPVDGKSGMVVDFAWIGECFESITEDLDHRLLNDVIPNPTAENIAALLFRRIKDEWIQGPGELAQLGFVRVWETPDSYAEVGPND